MLGVIGRAANLRVGSASSRSSRSGRGHDEARRPRRLRSRRAPTLSQLRGSRDPPFTMNSTTVGPSPREPATSRPASVPFPARRILWTESSRPAQERSARSIHSMPPAGVPSHPRPARARSPAGSAPREASMSGRRPASATRSSSRGARRRAAPARRSRRRGRPVDRARGRGRGGPRLRRSDRRARVDPDLTGRGARSLATPRRLGFPSLEPPRRIVPRAWRRRIP